MDQLLTTKLFIPRFSIDLVPRPRLYEQLDECLLRKFTLISAPTGFGKSTLVTAWLSDRDVPAAWLSLDEGDNDPVRFWTYFIAAVQTLAPEAGGTARQIVSVPQLRSIEPAAISLINDISRQPGELILILDDYHVIESETLHAGLAYLLEHQPPNFHLILITRVDPPISLARLRAHHQLVELRAQDLQFSSTESTSLFNEKMGLDLKPEHIQALTAHTENWVVGLQLAALSLQETPSYDSFIADFTGGHQFIFDYLTEEVLSKLPEAQRAFMLKTSILDRFCGSLCEAITGNPSSRQMLEDIRKKNLFVIPLDQSGHWFRYHHLFAEVLNALLERDHPGEIRTLHRNAAVWFEKEGYPGEAVDHSLRSGDTAQSIELILQHWLEALHRGEVGTILRWLDALPAELTNKNPYLLLARCWALFISGQNLAIAPYVELTDAACKQLADEGRLDRIHLDEVRAQLALMRSVLARARGEHASSLAHVEEAARTMPPERLEGIGTVWNMLAAARAGAGDYDGAIDAYTQGIELSYAQGNLVGAYLCTYGQLMYMMIQGRLSEAERLCRSAIERAVREGHGSFPAAGSLYVTMSRIEFERNSLDDAEAYLDTGLRIASPGGFSEAVRTGRYLLANLAAARGRLKAAAEFLRDAERIVNAIDDDYFAGELNWEWGKLHLAAGDTAAAREKLIALEEKRDSSQHANLVLWQRLLSSRLLLAEANYEQALRVLDESIRRSRASHSHGELVRLQVLQAVALDALGRRKAALSALQEALALGAPEGYIIRWLDAGPGIGPLLRVLRADRSTPAPFHAYLDSLLDACQAAFGEAAQPQLKETDHPLTDRELDILRLISSGFSNPEIAGELVITLNTVKKHTSNIYGKLGVRSRTQAIARARQLNLL